MKRFFNRVLVFLGSITLVLILLMVGFSFYQAAVKGQVPEKTILQVDLGTEIVEYAPDIPLSRVLAGDQPTILNTVQALERAARDPQVVMLLARVDNTGMGLARTQELRNAVLAFRRQGKPAMAFAETFGEFGPGNQGYYLATAFDRIYLQPSGNVGLTGLIYETPFLQGALAKLELKPRFDRRKEYKNALDFLTERGYTPSHEKALRKVMESHFGQLTGAIAEARGLGPDQVRALIDRGPFSASEALEAGLVDELGYHDQVMERLRSEAGDGAEPLSLAEYRQRTARKETGRATVALIYGAGAIQRGESEFNPLTGSPVMGSDTLAAAFRDAAEDPDVAAILFRVDSPGGSYVASDTVWRAIRQARAAGKPVVASMGDTAGSGGYFVAMAADKIVAHPATLTGSIGVLAGKLVTDDFWRNLGVAWDEIHTGAHAGIWSQAQDYSPEEWARFQAWLDRVYADFTAKVAESREMPLEKVQKIAKGRIWTGEDAKQLELVDDLGGFPEALALVKTAIGIDPDEAVTLRMFPRPQPFWSRLLEGPWAGGRGAALLGRALGPVTRLAESSGVYPEPGVLFAPVPAIR